MKYKIDKSFPSIDKLDDNGLYGQMILSHLGGLHSEMNKVSLYFYNSIILEKELPELSEIMKNISRVEMQHLEILAKMCFYLGVDPRLWESKNDLLEYWSPGYNVYPKQVESMLRNAIMLEKQSIDNYSFELLSLDEPIIQEVIEHIILDHKLHVQIFENILHVYEKGNYFQ